MNLEGISIKDTKPVYFAIWKILSSLLFFIVISYQHPTSVAPYNIQGLP